MSGQLSRDRHGRPAAPVRIVHLGIGNFARAHQAWYTEHAPDHDQWGIAAFTGRSATVADQLTRSGGLFHLVTRSAEGDTFDVVQSLSCVHPADDMDAWRRHLADPAVSVVTTTITEAGYRRSAEGGLDVDDPEVAADLDTLARDPQGATSTAPGRLLSGLLARRAAGAGALTIVPCDNIPDNGAMVARLLREGAAVVDPSLVEWIEQHVGVASTMVDRITPRTTPDDLAEVRQATGLDDPAAVVTEPFSEWVVQDSFAGPRPRWEEAGATLVQDVAPFERRKLLLLNGAHSLMAYAGSILGHQSVSEAVGDPRIRQWVEQWWDEASATIDLPAQDLADYRQALLTRFSNPRIRHLLAQIAADGSQKVPIRVVGVTRSLLEQGEVPAGAVRVLAAWLLHLRGHGAPVDDRGAEPLVPLVQGDLLEASQALLTHLGLTDPRLVPAVVTAAGEILS